MLHCVSSVCLFFWCFCMFLYFFWGFVSLIWAFFLCVKLGSFLSFIRCLLKLYLQTKQQVHQTKIGPAARFATSSSTQWVIASKSRSQSSIEDFRHLFPPALCHSLSLAFASKWSGETLLNDSTVSLKGTFLDLDQAILAAMARLWRFSKTLDKKSFSSENVFFAGWAI